MAVAKSQLSPWLQRTVFMAAGSVEHWLVVLAYVDRKEEKKHAEHLTAAAQSSSTSQPPPADEKTKNNVEKGKAKEIKSNITLAEPTLSNNKTTQGNNKQGRSITLQVRS